MKTKHIDKKYIYVTMVTIITMILLFSLSNNETDSEKIINSIIMSDKVKEKNISTIKALINDNKNITSSNECLKKELYKLINRKPYNINCGLK